MAILSLLPLGFPGGNQVDGSPPAANVAVPRRKPLLAVEAELLRAGRGTSTRSPRCPALQVL